jgi:hypothetical protein
MTDGSRHIKTYKDIEEHLKTEALGKNFYILVKHWCKGVPKNEICNCMTEEINYYVQKYIIEEFNYQSGKREKPPGGFSYSEYKYSIEEFEKEKKSGELTNCTKKLNVPSYFLIKRND